MFINLPEELMLNTGIQYFYNSTRKLSFQYMCILIL